MSSPVGPRLSNTVVFQYRQVQGNVCAASERADISEQSAARYRARARSSSAGPVSIRIFIFISGIIGVMYRVIYHNYF